MSCGSCTLCCKVLEITEISKPKDKWCGNCDIGKGCKIYENRPNPCREFECLWLHSQKPNINEKLKFPLSMRPDKSKVVLYKKIDGQLLAYVPTDRANAWKEGEIGNWLKRENEVRPVVIVCGKKVEYMSNLI